MLQEPFLDLMLPVLSRTLRASEAASSGAAAGKRMRAALRRRAHVAEKYAHTQEHGAVFKVGCPPHNKDAVCDVEQALAHLQKSNHTEWCTRRRPILIKRHGSACLITAADHGRP